MSRARVVYAFPTSHRFRVPFHERLRAELAARDIAYDYLYDPNDDNEGKGDTAAITWATPVRQNDFRVGRSVLRLQHAWTAAAGADLLIMQQQNNLMFNYLAQLRLVSGVRKLAFLGHGRNFQARDPNGLRDRFKRFWATKVDWWFAYTERSAEIVASYGFSRERITVFNNAIDTSAIGRELAAIEQTAQERLRQELFGGSQHVGLYLGGLYAEKRLPFLLEAAEAVRRAVPDFQLLVIGGGAEAELIRAAAARCDWIHYAGPKFGAEKSLLASLARVQLMPGLVGLGVLDSFAYGTPLVTSNVPYHSPEIGYLDNGRNGVMVEDPDDVAGYAAAVIRLLTDDAHHAALRAGAAEALATYTIENMVLRFADGVERALAAP
jgi:glycosyltransferase involved in cell wall biosynthesis